ncbi:porphobilinogen synthase, partial [Methanosalsum natronophilum]
MFPHDRMRRLRSPSIRKMVRETLLAPNDLIYPMFVDETIDSYKPVPSMPGVNRVPLSEAANEAKSVADLDIPAVILFGIPHEKDETGTCAYGDDDVVQNAVRSIKDELGDDMVVITDVCLCEYTSHGHCGIIDRSTKEILNDPTLEILGEVAISHANAGADIVAPSGMMDGIIGKIRSDLDMNN